MRGMWSTVALVLVLAGLGAYIYFVDSEKPAPGMEPKEKVFAVESGKINEVRITAGGETTALVKKDTGWTVTEPIATEADPTESASLATNIASMEQTRVVDENATDLAPYGLKEPRIKVAFKAEGNVSGEVFIGDTTPMQGDIYATTPGSNKVFLVSSFNETTFNKRPFDLRDKRVVKFDRDKVDSLELTRGGDTIHLTRSGNDWVVDAPMKGRGDYAAVEGLLTRLSTAGMASIVDGKAADLKSVGLDSPFMRIVVGQGSSRAALEIGRPEGDSSYARDTSRPLVFTLDKTLAEDLTKPFEQYHKKELFESRAFSMERVKITRRVDGTPKTWEFVKTKGTDADKWQVTPEGGQATDADSAKVDALLNALAALRLGTFAAPAARTGMDAPVLAAAVSYDEGKFERVRVGTVADRFYANREGEQVTGALEQAAVDAVLKALDEALAPPAPATAPAAAPATPPAKP
jgi:Domain of unknown function (DUF4340)